MIWLHCRLSLNADKVAVLKFKYFNFTTHLENLWNVWPIETRKKQVSL